MSANGNAPVIIKKIKKVSGDGHHGGAWKVAYADFVTAMMAFFLLMWLLNATTEKQRKGIADYFSPTIPVNRVSGGGDGSFGGDSIFTEESLTQSGTGGLPTDFSKSEQKSGGKDDSDEAKELGKIEDVLLGRTGESMVSNETLRHIVTRVTDEGLLVELFDLEGDPLFSPTTGDPEPVMIELVTMIGEVFALVTNGVAIEGHVAVQPVVVAENTVWEVSAGRAHATRNLLETLGFAPDRIKRITGHADRQPFARNTMSIRNNRIELILLRSRN